MNKIMSLIIEWKKGFKLDMREGIASSPIFMCSCDHAWLLKKKEKSHRKNVNFTKAQALSLQLYISLCQRNLIHISKVVNTTQR